MIKCFWTVLAASHVGVHRPPSTANNATIHKQNDAAMTTRFIPGIKQ